MKKSTIKSLKKIKFLFLARGPGETGQARALAKYISKKGAEILFCLLQEKNLFFLKEDKNFKIFLTENSQKLKKVLKKEKPDVLLIFNSKTWGGNFLEKPSFKKPKLTLCFDSNWLFNDKKYPNFSYLKWVDEYFVLFPKKIFDLGLKENGGDFEIKKNVLEKIIPVGFIPSYKKPPQKQVKKIRKFYNFKKGERFIFSYFSGWGAGHRTWALENFVRAVDKLIKKKRKIKAIYVGPMEGLNLAKIKRNWLILKEKLSAKDFFLTLASSDLVFQHQGMVTLAQAISCQIPVICNVSILKEEISRLHFWEVRPFQKTGVCEIFSKSTPIIKISKKIEELLFNRESRKKMIKNQKIIFEDGEKRAFEIIKNLL